MISPSSTVKWLRLARRFTALVGRPPLDYLTWWRMTTAGTLPRLDGTPLHTLAQRTGYTSEPAFKREYGTTPGTYRRHHLPSAQRAVGGRHRRWQRATDGAHTVGRRKAEAAAPGPLTGWPRFLTDQKGPRQP
ncbi:helix-turn-helix domain-containing protein [Streptomyces sp. NPDC092296]|uniref:helix-turn-helix domain-containing protein n=1 Tax=Streptomyces sp. NPDC092296 TaxID=3366012 RepID=UPI0037FC94E3